MDKGSLRKILNMAQKVLHNPCNTLTIDNPDDLLIVDDKLIGLFYPNGNERKSPHLFLRRVLNSKLVYSDHMLVVLILDKDTNIWEDNTVLASANTWMEEQEFSKFIKRVNNSSNSNLNFTPSIRQRILSKYSSNLNMFTKGRGIKTSYRPIHLTEKKKIVYKNLTLNNQGITYRKEWNNGKAYDCVIKNYDKKFKSLDSSLQAFLTNSFYMHFQIEEEAKHYGIYFRSTNPMNAFFNTQLAEFGKADIIKLCFAGFVPVEFSSLDDCKRLIELSFNEKK